MRTEAEKKIIKEIQSLKQNLQRSIQRVKKYEKEFRTPSPARKKFAKIHTSVKGKDLKELLKLKRQLLYVKGLKTSKVRGFKHYVFVFREVTSSLTSDELDKFWELYNKAVEENRLWENFKYELMIELHDSIAAGKSDEEIHERINMLYDKLDINEDVLSGEGFYKDWYEASDWT